MIAIAESPPKAPRVRGCPYGTRAPLHGRGRARGPGAGGAVSAAKAVKTNRRTARLVALGLAHRRRTADPAPTPRRGPSENRRRADDRASETHQARVPTDTIDSDAGVRIGARLAATRLSSLG